LIKLFHQNKERKAMNRQLLETIVTLTDTDIISLPSYVFFTDAEKAYKKRLIHSFAWNDQENLLAYTSDGHALTFRWEEYGPVASCDCRQEQYRLCLHAIALLLTVRTVFAKGRKPTALKDVVDDYKMQLIGNEPFDSSAIAHKNVIFTLHIELNHDDIMTGKQVPFTLTVKKNGIDRPSYDRIPLPSALVQLFSGSGKSEEYIINFLKQHGSKYAIYAHTECGVLRLNYSEKPDCSLTPKTEFKVLENSVEMRRLGEYKGAITDKFILVGKKLFIAVDDRVLGLRGDNLYQENWDIAHNIMLTNCFRGKNKLLLPLSSEAYKITFDFFYETMISFKKKPHQFLHNFIFIKHGAITTDYSTPVLIYSMQAVSEKESVDSTGSPRADLTSPRGEGSITLSVSAQQFLPSGDYHGSLGIFAGLLAHYMEKIDKNLGYVRKKEHSVMRELLFKIILAGSQQEASFIINKTLDRLSENDVYAKKTLHAFWNKMAVDFYGAYGHTLFFNSHEVCVAEADILKAWSPIAIAMLLFEEHCMYYTGDGVIHVEEKIFYAKLGEFKALLDERSIELSLDGKLIQIAQIEAALDARRSLEDAVFDWFEIKPEIMYEGIPITDEEWEQILLNGGTFQRDGRIHIVDRKSQDTLSLIARLIGKDKRTSSKKEIVEIPRLQIFDLIELLQQGVRVSLSKEDRQIIDNLMNFKKVEEISTPEKLGVELREYQKTGYEWLAFLYKHRFGACLADDMGLGKTVQAIALLGGIAEEKFLPAVAQKKPHLVVVPPSLIFNWHNEMQKFYPALRVAEYSGAKRLADFDKHDVVLTSYDVVRLDIDELKEHNFDVIIFDEAQAIKNITAKRTSAVRQLRGNFKLCLTGTPLENNVTEYYSIMDLAVPGVIPHMEKAVSKKIDEGIFKHLIQRTRPFILRRTKSEILVELPEKMENDIYFSMSNRQKALYNKVVAEIKRTIDRAYKEKTAYQASIVALTALLRLRQICISPYLVDKESAIESPKVEYLIETINELAKEGQAALVFSQFVGSLDIVEKEFIKHKVAYLRIDGSTPMGKRKDIVKNFQESNSVAVLLLSLKVGGVGLNLTRANHVFHIDPWWNPAVENQASDRAHRMGQNQKVFVHRLLMHHSIEEKMMQLKSKKRELFESVMEGAAHKNSEAITKADFDFLLS
jgi:superfamily II DNA or RNA helicase